MSGQGASHLLREPGLTYCGLRAGVDYDPFYRSPSDAEDFCEACKQAQDKETTPMVQKKKKNKRSNGASASDRSKKVERDRYTQMLPCKIDKEDVDRASAELAKLIRERGEVLARKKAVNSNFREKIHFYDERLKELGTSIEGGTERRSVECVDYLLPTNEIQTVRVDTGEVIESRAATAEELQEPFGFDKKPAAKDKRQLSPAPEPAEPEPKLDLGDE